MSHLFWVLNTPLPYFHLHHPRLHISYDQYHRFSCLPLFLITICMKNSKSTTITAATVPSCWIAVIIVIVLGSAANTESSRLTPQETTSTNAHKLSNHKTVQVANYDSFYPSLHRLLLLQRQRHHPPPPQPPPPPQYSDGVNKIDPRYGVEKRLVPSGPNPLHNWQWTILLSLVISSTLS